MRSSRSNLNPGCPVRSSRMALDRAALWGWPIGGMTLFLDRVEESLELAVVKLLRLARMERHVGLKRVPPQ